MLRIADLRIDAAAHLSKLQRIMTLPRETLPQLTADAARDALTDAAAVLGLEFVENKGVAPIFALLPRGDAAPATTFFATWHFETLPVTPAAVEGAERLALAVTLGALEDVATAGAFSGLGSPALVVAPGSAHGSRVLDPFLRANRARLTAPVAYWIRILPSAPRRRRIYLGGRGRVVIGIWGREANPYEIRDRVVEALRDDAYGPRPLDFDLVRKLAQSRDALDFLEETIEGPEAATSDGETRLRTALFEPHGQIVVPGASHPDRPAAWLSIEIAEGMEPAEIERRVKSLAAGSRVEMAEALPWDRIGIHHPAIHALMPLSKSRSAGPDVWPSAPWVTPSGLFTRALGTPLAEWGVPIPAGNAIRFPTPEAFEAMLRETAELALRGIGALEESES